MLDDVKAVLVKRCPGWPSLIVYHALLSVHPVPHHDLAVPWPFFAQAGLPCHCLAANQAFPWRIPYASSLFNALSRVRSDFGKHRFQRMGFMQLRANTSRQVDSLAVLEFGMVKFGLVWLGMVLHGPTNV